MAKMTPEEFKATVDRLVAAVTIDSDPYSYSIHTEEENNPMKTTELIERLANLRFVTAELHGSVICIYKRQHGDNVEPLPFYKINVKAMDLKEGCTETHRVATQGGLTLVAYDKILELLREYLATPMELRAEEKLYYVKLPSGHYMRFLYEKPYSAPAIEWATSKGLAKECTEKEIKAIDPVYWQFAEEVN